MNCRCGDCDEFWAGSAGIRCEYCECGPAKHARLDTDGHVSVLQGVAISSSNCAKTSEVDDCTKVGVKFCIFIYIVYCTNFRNYIAASVSRHNKVGHSVMFYLRLFVSTVRLHRKLNFENRSSISRYNQYCDKTNNSQIKLCHRLCLQVQLVILNDENE